MAELLKVQRGNNIPKDLRDQFREIQHIREDDKLVIYGILRASNRRKQIGKKTYEGSLKRPPKAPAPGTMGGGGSETNAVRLARRVSPTVPSPESKQVKKLKKQVKELKSQSKDVRRLEKRVNNLEKSRSKLEDRHNALVDGLTTGSIPEVTDPSDNQITAKKPRKIYNKSTGWVGRKLPWKGQPQYIDRRFEDRTDGPVWVVNEDRRDSYTRKERKRGAVAVGALALLAAAGVFAGLWAADEDGGKTTANTAPATLTTTTANPGVAKPAGHQQEISFKGLKGFKVSLPADLAMHLNTQKTFYEIDDAADHTIVPHVMWDEQGNLDKNTRLLLHEDPYEDLELTQHPYDYHTPGTNFNHHYETIVHDQ